MMDIVKNRKHKLFQHALIVSLGNDILQDSLVALADDRPIVKEVTGGKVWRNLQQHSEDPTQCNGNMPLSRRLDRCDRVIQDEVGDSIRGNV